MVEVKMALVFTKVKVMKATQSTKKQINVVGSKEYLFQTIIWNF
jgi:hypothetical protein